MHRIRRRRRSIGMTKACRLPVAAFMLRWQHAERRLYRYSMAIGRVAFALTRQRQSNGNQCLIASKISLREFAGASDAAISHPMIFAFLPPLRLLIHLAGDTRDRRIGAQAVTRTRREPVWLRRRDDDAPHRAPAETRTVRPSISSISHSYAPNKFHQGRAPKRSSR